MIPQTVIIGGIASVIICILLSTCIIFFSIKNDSRRNRRNNERQRRITRARFLEMSDIVPASTTGITGSEILYTFGMVLSMVVISIMCVCFCQKKRLNRRDIRRQRGRAQPDQSSIYNISGRVQDQSQYPDAYLSIDHINVVNELNKPPKYDDDAPPSYEEALKLAMANSNSMQTFQEEQAQTSNEQAARVQNNAAQSSAAANRITE